MATRKKTKKVVVPIDLTAEDAYWRSNYQTRPYVEKKARYERYRPAYLHAVELHATHGGKTFAEIEEDARKAWEKTIEGHRAAAAPAVAAETVTVKGAAAKAPKRKAAVVETGPLTWEEARPAVQDAWDRTLTLSEEQLRVGKEKVETGDVQVRKEVITETKTIDVPVEREEVVIERRPARGRAGKGKIGAAETIRIPVKEEQVHVTKEAVVVEEVNLRKRKVTDTKKVTGTVRREEAVVEETGTAKVTDAGGVKRRKKT